MIQKIALLATFGFALVYGSSSAVQAAPPDWTIFGDDHGTSVPYPRGIFSVRAADDVPPGPVLTTEDGRARLHIFTVANERNENPAQFIRRVITDHTRRLAYQRVTRNFFVFSATERDRIQYRRCNFARDRVGPGEKWDESKMKPYPAGTFYSEPSKAPHFTWAKDGEVIIQLTGMRPSGKTAIPQ